MKMMWGRALVEGGGFNRSSAADSIDDSIGKAPLVYAGASGGGCAAGCSQSSVAFIKATRKGNLTPISLAEDLAALVEAEELQAIENGE